jgi:hypothetical protein
MGKSKSSLGSDGEYEYTAVESDLDVGKPPVALVLGAEPA